MKIPAQLSKGLSKAEQSELESQLKGLLARQLRKYLNDAMTTLEVTEEAIDIEPNQIYSIVGQRRGYRHILNLLPEDTVRLVVPEE